MDKLDLLSLSYQIEEAFKSLTECGRPDIKDEHNMSLIPKLYVDLFGNNYVLNQAIDEHHVIFKGRRGTGKSTIFLQAENIIKENRKKIPIYINLQTCFEDIRSANSESNNELSKYWTYYNFFKEILETLRLKINKFFHQDKELKELFQKIENGDYIDEDFQRSLQVSTSSEQEKNTSIETNFAPKKYSVDVTKSNILKNKQDKNYELHELRVYSINLILKKLKQILLKHHYEKVYLFLDDFGELTFDNQKMLVDSLISPIITSYNDMFVVKLAAYPHRIYFGNIDSTKIMTCSLDFYDVYATQSRTYSDVENSVKDYVKRTLEKRIQVYTDNQLELSDIFDTKTTPLDVYISTLFFASAGIPRSLGYILTNCFLGSINQGNPITLENIKTASQKYFNEKILADFYNDARYKQSFLDDNKILTQHSQKCLMDKLIEQALSFKREQIKNYRLNKCKKIFAETIKKYKRNISVWLPSSHFTIDKEIEGLLQTLELYFIVNKFNETSSKNAGKKNAVYGLNYGLCLQNSIDYGRPELRDTYDYWRQKEFNYSDLIPRVLSSIETPKCIECGFIYENTAEYETARKYNICLKCKATGSVKKINQFEESFKTKIQNWKKISLPDLYINILRLLYNNCNRELTAYEIGNEVEVHHLSLTQPMNKLKKLGYISFRKDAFRRYYKIEEKAILLFFQN